MPLVEALVDITFFDFFILLKFILCFRFSPRVLNSLVTSQNQSSFLEQNGFYYLLIKERLRHLTEICRTNNTGGKEK